MGKATHLGGVQRFCPVCGREFYVYVENWVYKESTKEGPIYYCSWSCLRKKEAGDVILHHRGIRQSNSAKIEQMILDGLSDKEIAILMGMSTPGIRYHRRKLRERRLKDDADNIGRGIEALDQLDTQDGELGKAGTETEPTEGNE